MLRLACYAAIFGVWLYSLYFDVRYIPTKVAGASWFVKLKYLTILNMVAQTIYFGICFVRAIVDQLHRPSSNRRRKLSAVPSYYPSSTLHRINDLLYATIAFPIGMFVVGMFWSLYAIDRELIYPKFLDDIIPNWMNHVMHTAPFAFVLVDTLLVCHKYPNRMKGVMLLIVLGLLYEASIFFWFYQGGLWIYPIFGVLNTLQRFIFCVVGLLVMLGLYEVGFALNRMVWGEASHPTIADETQINLEDRRVSMTRIGGGKKYRRD